MAGRAWGSQLNTHLGEDDGDSASYRGINLKDLAQKWEGLNWDEPPPIKGKELGLEGVIDEEAPTADFISANREAISLMYDLVHNVAEKAVSDIYLLGNTVADRINAMNPAVNGTLSSILGLREAVGDIVELDDEGGEGDIIATLIEITRSPSAANQVAALTTKLTHLEQVLEAVIEDLGDDIVSSVEPAFLHLKLVYQCLSSLESGGVATISPQPQVGLGPTASAPGSSLRFDTQVTNASGGLMGTLGDLFSKSLGTSSKLEAALARITKLEADVKSQGGAIFGAHTFASIQDAEALSLAESTSGKGFAAFVNVFDRI